MATPVQTELSTNANKLRATLLATTAASLIFGPAFGLAGLDQKDGKKELTRLGAVLATQEHALAKDEANLSVRGRRLSPADVTLEADTPERNTQLATDQTAVRATTDQLADAQSDITDGYWQDYGKFVALDAAIVAAGALVVHLGRDRSPAHQ